MPDGGLTACLRHRRLKILAPLKRVRGLPIWRSAYHCRSYRDAVSTWPAPRRRNGPCAYSEALTTM